MGLHRQLNRDPQSNDQLKDCGYIEIRCLYCPEHFQHSAIESHQSELCPGRPSTCPTLQHFDLVFRILKLSTGQYVVLFLYSLPKINNCDKTEDIIYMVLEIVNCDFKHVGRTEKQTHKDKFAHLENVASNLSLQMLI